MFVAESARKFIAKYMIALYNSSTIYNNTHSKTDDGDSTMHHCFRLAANTLSTHLPTCLKCIVNHLKNIIEESPTGLIRTMPFQVSIAQLLLSLMEENAVAAQEILHPSSIVLSCLKIFNNANKQECGKVADVIFTMLANTRCLT